MDVGRLPAVSEQALRRPSAGCQSSLGRPSEGHIKVNVWRPRSGPQVVQLVWVIMVFTVGYPHYMLETCKGGPSQICWSVEKTQNFDQVLPPQPWRLK